MKLSFFYIFTSETIDGIFMILNLSTNYEIFKMLLKYSNSNNIHNEGNVKKKTDSKRYS